MEDLDSLVQVKIDADSDFQATLVDLSDDDKATALATKRSEVLKTEWSALAEKAKKNEELANNYKTRAEKAEKATKKTGDSDTPKTAEKSELSTDDVFVLIDAKVPKDDIDEVKKAAKLLGKSISEALADPVVKTILKDRAEIRKTNEAMNTKPARPGSKKASGAELMRELSEGKVPQPGSAEAEELFFARHGGK